jgi:hypothetical protein
MSVRTVSNWPTEKQDEGDYVRPRTSTADRAFAERPRRHRLGISGMEVSGLRPVGTTSR